MVTVHPSCKVSTGGSMLAFSRRRVGSGRAGADRDTSTCDQLCRILGGLNKALHVCIQPFWVILPCLFPAHHFALIVATLFSTCDAKCRTGAERESNREKQKGPCRWKRRRWNEPAGRVLLIFSNIWSVRRRRRKMERRLSKKDGETRVKLEGRERRRLCVFFHPSPARWPSVSCTCVATVTA